VAAVTSAVFGDLGNCPTFRDTLVEVEVEVEVEPVKP
jgi:hypothetical protein